jgi:hypothetical protein
VNFATAFTSLDKDQAARWIQWVSELGGMGRHKLFIMPAKGERADFQTSIPFEVVPDYYGITSDWSTSNDAVRDAGGANSMLRQFAQFFAFRKIGPWTFIEPDCIPLRAGWHDEWEADYKCGGQPFMGAIVNVPNVPKHSTGNMVLPENAADLYVKLMLPQIANIGGKSIELAFDVAAADEILAHHHETHLIQHVFRGPKFEKPEDLARIDSRACLWHSDKDGGLIRLLKQRKEGDEPCATNNATARSASVEITGSTATNVLPQSDGATMSNPSPAPKSLVHTYFRPCDDPDALVEQKKILAIWERSWREAGFEPVILTEAHARKHPRCGELRAAFESKPTISPKGYEMACWLRWLAMSEVGGGFMTDYDVLPFGPVPGMREVDPDHRENFPIMLCVGVPCAVVGNSIQFDHAIASFEMCKPVTEQGQPHLSDMHAAQKLGFPSLDICREYGKPGWKEAKLVHFNHYSCNPRKRSECMDGAFEERVADAYPTDALHSDHVPAPKTWIGDVREHVRALALLVNTNSRKDMLRTELRKVKLLGQGKKRK